MEYKDKFYTLLLAPLQNFYLKPNRGKTQLRIAMVESPSYKKDTNNTKKLFIRISDNVVNLTRSY